MGFKRAITDAHGIEHPEAYYRIVFIDLDYRSSKGSYVVHVYKDQAA